MRSYLLKLFFVLLIAGGCALPAFAADKYQPAPLKLLAERVDQHDQQIGEIDQRVSTLESSGPREIKVNLVITREGDVREASEPKPAEAKAAQEVAVAYQAPQPQSTARRLKTTAELQRDLRTNWTSTVYATVEPRSWAKTHLVNDHGYTASQVNGLSQDEAWMLHNLAHNQSRRISAYTSGTAQPTTASARKPATYSSANMDCPDGQCPVQPSRTTTSRSRSGWRPGRLLFGR